MSFDDVLTLETEREAVGNALQVSLKAVAERQVQNGEDIMAHRLNLEERNG